MNLQLSQMPPKQRNADSATTLLLISKSSSETGKYSYPNTAGSLEKQKMITLQEEK